MYLKNSLIVVLFFVLSCQPVEILQPVEIDISNFDKISINTKEIEIHNKYKPYFAKNNIEDQIQHPPIDLMITWNNENILKSYDNLNVCLTELKSQNVYAVTKFGSTNFTHVKFSIGDTLIFGSETKGLPNDVLNKFSEGNKLFIPMVKNSRSLNLSNAVSIVIYEAWRQQKFKNSELFNEK